MLAAYTYMFVFLFEGLLPMYYKDENYLEILRKYR